ncbi:MAG: S41 family peptidase [Chthoniobacteraceae bacterium]
MTRYLASLLALLLTITLPALAAPPKVVKAAPDNAQNDVDPSVSELRIVFDQPMNPGGRSIVNSSRGLLPEFIDKPQWDNDRTFVWKMKLQPNTGYWLSINSRSGEPAEPYPIAFRTRGAGGAAAAAAMPVVAAANRTAIEQLRQAIDRDYSYRDLRKVDWPARFKEFAPQLEAAQSPAEFASVAARMLSAAEDIHLAMKVGEQRIATHRRDVFPCFSLPILERTVPRWKRSGAFTFTGQFAGGIRYLCIASLPADDARFLLACYEAVGEAAAAGKPLILDLRPNGGGDEPAAQKIAGCFVEKPVVYARHTMRAAGQFSAPNDRVLAPNPAGPKFRGKVAVLTGPGTCSSCESFVLMMKQAPGCITVGARTAGSSGNPRSVDLGNGTAVAVPRWKALRLDGTCFEGEGIAPDVELKVGPKDFEQQDPILAEAIKKLAE